MLNQVDRRPSTDRKSSPLTETSCLLPPSVIFSTRPPHWPCPSRLSMVIEVRSPRAGHAFSTFAAETFAVQEWFGLPENFS